MPRIDIQDQGIDEKIKLVFYSTFVVSALCAILQWVAMLILEGTVAPWGDRGDWWVYEIIGICAILAAVLVFGKINDHLIAKIVYAALTLVVAAGGAVIATVVTSPLIGFL